MNSQACTIELGYRVRTLNVDGFYVGGPVSLFNLIGGRSKERTSFVATIKAMFVDGSDLCLDMDRTTTRLSGLIGPPVPIVPTVVGDYSTAEGSGTSVGDYSHAGGRESYADLESKWTTSNGKFVSNGDNQTSILMVSVATTNATPTNLVINGSSLLLIRSGFTYGFLAHIIGRKSDGSANASFIRRGMIQNNSGTCALVGSIATIGTDINSPSWSIAITADNTNKALQIQVTGASSTNIHWSCRLDLVEVS